MRSIRIAGLLAVALLTLTAIAGAAEIRGSYLEARNAEIYASHCFANSELGLRGDLAAMAWKIEDGALDGVSLDGLGVVAVVRASATLGDPFTSPLPAKAVLIVDERASAEQRTALQTFARKSAGALLDNIVRIDAAPISLDFHGDLHARKATMTAGDLLRIETRAIRGTDSLCHLDDLYYGPLVELDHAMPAFSLQTRFSGEGLGVVFNDRNRSSAFLGTFTVGSDSLSD
jgi:hypothetical protein